MNSDMFNRFSENPVNMNISRSMFNRDHSVKFSGNVGDLIPFYVDEVLPGDTFNVDTAKVVRMQPLVCPVMDNLYLDTYYFFVPNRIIWDHFKEFMGESTNEPWIQSTEYTIPKLQIPSDGFACGTIADYMGIPINAGAGQKINALPFRAYAMICNEWFRDENVMTPIHITKDETTVLGVNTDDQVTDIEKGGKPFVCAKLHDYFTSALPAPQRASASQVQFALNGLLPVNAYSGYNNITTGTNVADLGIGSMQFKSIDSSSLAQPISGQHHMLNNAGIAAYASGTVSESPQSMTPSNLWANLDNTSVFDINSLRTAFAIQRYYERSARSGNRYREFVKGFFNVTIPDARVQIPEYLGGNRLPISVSEVVQSSESNLTPQGNTAAYSATGDSSSDFTKSFTEHGWVIGVCVMRYQNTYQQGLERFWLEDTNFDIYNPVFANLSEQPIKARELYIDASATQTFGYQEAWANYRYKPNRVAGELRSAYQTPLDMWHFADYYGSTPTLSAEWMRVDKSNVDRALAVTSSVSNQFIADFYISCSCARPMPLYSIPGLIDHN